MSGDYIGVHVKTSDPAAVQREAAGLFTSEGFALLGNELLSLVVDNEDALPEGDDWYGLIVSGKSGASWVSVYVADWLDSGVLAKGLSATLTAPVLEVWVSDNTRWGYTYFVGGAVRDRFADHPESVAETPQEQALYRGNADALAAVLRGAPPKFQDALRAAQANAGQFAGGAVDALAEAVGLPFEHVFTGYEAFFEDDPEDYGPSLENWPQFRHLAFQPPAGRETLAE